MSSQQPTYLGEPAVGTPFGESVNQSQLGGNSTGAPLGAGPSPNLGGSGVTASQAPVVQASSGYGSSTTSTGAGHSTNPFTASTQQSTTGGSISNPSYPSGGVSSADSYGHTTGSTGLTGSTGNTSSSYGGSSSAQQQAGQTYDNAAQSAQQTGQYAQQKTGQAYDSTAQSAQQTSQYTQQKAGQAYDSAAQTAQQARDQAANTYDSAAQSANQTLEQGKQQAAQTYNQLPSSEEVKQKATEVGQSAQRTAEQTAADVKRAAVNSDAHAAATGGPAPSAREAGVAELKADPVTNIISAIGGLVVSAPGAALEAAAARAGHPEVADKIKSGLHVGAGHATNLGNAAYANLPTQEQVKSGAASAYNALPTAETVKGTANQAINTASNLSQQAANTISANTPASTQDVRATTNNAAGSVQNTASNVAQQAQALAQQGIATVQSYLPAALGGTTSPAGTTGTHTGASTTGTHSSSTGTGARATDAGTHSTTTGNAPSSTTSSYAPSSATSGYTGASATGTTGVTGDTTYSHVGVPSGGATGLSSRAGELDGTTHARSTYPDLTGAGSSEHKTTAL